MDVEKFLKLCERYLNEPLAVIADKEKFTFWYIQDKLKEGKNDII